jgi:hypothetical protein
MVVRHAARIAAVTVTLGCCTAGADTTDSVAADRLRTATFDVVRAVDLAHPTPGWRLQPRCGPDGHGNERWALTTETTATVTVDGWTGAVAAAAERLGHDTDTDNGSKVAVTVDDARVTVTAAEPVRHVDGTTVEQVTVHASGLFDGVHPDWATVDADAPCPER